jgi:glycosyltransferase involved in cell wall biosynthesis
MVEPASRRYPQLVQRAAARGALVHVTAQAIGDEVVQMLGVPAEQVRVVAGGIEPSEPGDPARGRRIAGSDAYVLAVGTVEPRKGFVDLIAAFERLAAEDADAGLVIAGADGWGAEAVARAWEESPVRRRIRRLGWVDDETKRDLLAGAAVLAMPSVYEGFGYPPLEAMAAGVPVVATSVGSLPEVLGDAASFIAPSDVDALAAALRTVLGDAATRAAMRTAGLARAAAFTWASAASAMARVYDEAAAR